MKNLPTIFSLLFIFWLCAASESENYTIERDINRQPITNKVVLEIFFESHCSGCHTFITTQLKPLLKIKNILDYVVFQLIPFGHGTAQKVGNRYHFKCQHGQSECQGNILMTCALNKLETMKALQFIVCLQDSKKRWNIDGQNCSSQLGINWKQIKTCTNSLYGRFQQYMNGLRTKKINPKYVPALYVNGATSNLMAHQLFQDALKVICNSMDRSKPTLEQCNKYWKEESK